MRAVIAIACVLTIGACTTDLSSEAELVRQIPAETQSACTFLGAVSGSESLGIDTGGDADSAFNKVRNAVAAKGGNAFVLSNSISNGFGTNVQADAYRCPT